ncbi:MULTISPECIES: hypothetical protein [unclassified Streptomyces]|uniref:hypothetical protein n=1 Tax=unclassified Streptomyces TaxID=2593676 RepID=UPI0011611198|nr:hypothetical protein [Streptomyces sp. TSRI0281]
MTIQQTPPTTTTVTTPAVPPQTGPAPAAPTPAPAPATAPPWLVVTVAALCVLVFFLVCGFGGFLVYAYPRLLDPLTFAVAVAVALFTLGMLLVAIVPLARRL